MDTVSKPYYEDTKDYILSPLEIFNGIGSEIFIDNFGSETNKQLDGLELIGQVTSDDGDLLLGSGIIPGGSGDTSDLYKISSYNASTNDSIVAKPGQATPNPCLVPSSPLVVSVSATGTPTEVFGTLTVRVKYRKYL